MGSAGERRGAEPPPRPTMRQRGGHRIGTPGGPGGSRTRLPAPCKGGASPGLKPVRVGASTWPAVRRTEVPRRAVGHRRPAPTRRFPLRLGGARPASGRSRARVRAAEMFGNYQPRDGARGDWGVRRPRVAGKRVGRLRRGDQRGCRPGNPRGGEAVRFARLVQRCRAGVWLWTCTLAGSRLPATHGAAHTLIILGCLLPLLSSQCPRLGAPARTRPVEAPGGEHRWLDSNQQPTD